MLIFRAVVRALLYIQLLVLVGRASAAKKLDQQHKPEFPSFNRDAINVNNLPVVKDTSLNQHAKQTSNNELIGLARKDDYIFLNTIDGVFYAIGKHDGSVKWSIKEEAVLTFPKNYENPYFLTDPRDGSLYIFTNEGDGLKKFPYTIAELVSASPSKSADGFLYTGDKKDQWIAIDYRSGHKLDTLTAETLSSKISVSDENMIFIGRTQYTITMFETSSMRKVFNLTYYDYSTHAQHKQNTPNKPTTQSANINKNSGQKTEANVYPYYHFSSSSDGTIVTLDRKTGELIWQLRLDNPIIAMYRYEGEQLFKINFAIFAVEALSNLDPNRFKMLHAEQKLLEQDSQPNINNSQPPTKNQQIQQTQRGKSHFVSTLYIGYFKKNFYALPALVYNSYLPSLEGPVTEVIKSNDSIMSIDSEDGSETGESVNGGTTTTTAIVIGHHKVPEKFDPPPNYIQPNNNLIVISNTGQNEDEANSYFNIFGTKQQPSCPADNVKNRSRMSASNFFKKLDQLFDNKYLWTLFTVLIASLLPLIRNVYLEKKKKKRRALQKQLQLVNGDTLLDQSDDDESVSNSSSNEDEDTSSRRTAKLNESRNSTKHSSSNKKNRSMTTSHQDSVDSVLKHSMSAPEFGNDGMIKIGKIMYDPTQRLGHGCSGTIVYKGSFEDRPVAVKRLLPECYTLADREVELLKHADQHKNVLRYFCTEADSQFRYIALELCQMTLHEYIHNQYNLDYPPQQPFRLLSILEQATKGLDHLHALDIVHRDIKPHNVLISFPDHKGYVYAMISDFGLCKRLEMGINSFSKKSGALGTEGWIAPELLDDIYGHIEDQYSDSGRETHSSQHGSDQEQVVIPKRITKSVDIFSMGCVYYFVLTGGSHPFGDSLRRQANILNNEFKTDKLGSANSETYMQRLLIEKMISNEAKERPTTKQVLAHPVFWSKAKTLQFLQDVSDRIEKIDINDPILVELERNANQIIRNNWKVHICQHLQNDLKKFRAYNGVCLRDLLRAIRNKKHHYRELTPEVAQSLGSLPDDFVDYFTSRFPKLILHVYEAMICCQDEPMLNVYYTFKESHF